MQRILIYYHTPSTRNRSCWVLLKRTLCRMGAATQIRRSRVTDLLSHVTDHANLNVCMPRSTMRFLWLYARIHGYEVGVVTFGSWLFSSIYGL
jgi:hypothetical protein